MKPIQKNDKVGNRRSEGVGEGEREKQKMESGPGCSKANKEARLVERKICFIFCFISEASNLRGRGVCVCGCVGGCVGVWVCVCVKGRLLSKR